MGDGEADSLADLRSLQRRYRELRRTDRDGATQPSVQSQADAVFARNTFSVKVPGCDPFSQCTFVMDADTIPRTIAWITIGQKVGNPSCGLYGLMGDRLLLITACLFKPQPTQFRGALGNTLCGFIHA